MSLAPAGSVRTDFAVGLAVVQEMTAQPRMMFLDIRASDVVRRAMGFSDPKFAMQPVVRKKSLTASIGIAKAFLKGRILKLRFVELGFGAWDKLVRN